MLEVDELFELDVDELLELEVDELLELEVDELLELEVDELLELEEDELLVDELSEVGRPIPSMSSIPPHAVIIVAIRIVFIVRVDLDIITLISLLPSMLISSLQDFDNPS
ncbi:hypothetical protein SAMN02745866_00275 [Alteromonadaceae bacterium Bs31]|nr:hypothetical protein SAMN02745866_00275 [Alteromonadaceae bacterium Bs31]